MAGKPRGTIPSRRLSLLLEQACLAEDRYKLPYWSEFQASGWFPSGLQTRGYVLMQNFEVPDKCAVAPRP